jgi:hypothetical protein
VKTPFREKLRLQTAGKNNLKLAESMTPMGFGKQEILELKFTRGAPHPGPLPWGEGEQYPVSPQIGTLRLRLDAGGGAPSPRGEGWGEGERAGLKPHVPGDCRNCQTP